MAIRKNQITYSEHPNRAARAAHARGDREFRTYDTSAIRPKQSKAPIVIIIIAIAVAIIVALLLFRACVPANLLPDTEEAIITVEQGEGAYQIGATLAEAGLVASADEFSNAVVAKGAESSLIPGSYTIQGGTSLDEIIDILQIGPAATGDRVTVSEGLTRQATAQAVSEGTGGRITVDEFLEASANASIWAAEYPFLETAGENSLEGFLFPKTYIVTGADDAVQVVNMMLNQFQIETADLDWSYPESQGLDLYQAVTLASIVEKETYADYGSTVASVFYNRLNSERPYLESDATTAYEVGHDPTGEEVHADTPYSTYSNPGLPPTPICSPSLPYLQAVCHPDQTDYMFFYYGQDADGNFNYYFSRTYEEHQAAIAGS